MSRRTSARPLHPGASRVRRGPTERLVAWLHIGPLGHLVAFLGDLGAALPSYWRRRVRAALSGHHRGADG